MHRNGDSPTDHLDPWLTVWSSRSRKGHSARVAWLRHAGHPCQRASQVMRLFADDGINIWIMDSETTPPESVLSFDLIVLESGSSQFADLTESLQAIRAGCYAPVLVLFLKKSALRSHIALEAGADAVVTMATPAEVVFAHSKALLRRWLPQGG